MSRKARGHWLGALALFAATSGARQSPPAPRWPLIGSFSRTFAFGPEDSLRLSLTLRSPSGRPLYRLDCDHYDNETPDFDYSGDFECRLLPLYRGTPYSTLLTDDPHQNRDWQSRGRFLIPELRGRCADYPEYGRVRHFRLRGMRLTLALSDITFMPDAFHRNPVEPLRRLRSFSVAVQADPDATALSAIDEGVRVVEPPIIAGSDNYSYSLACDSVVRSAHLVNRWR